MSHDQKPARVRVVRNAATPKLRRRNDPATTAVVIDQVADRERVAAASPTSIAGMLLGIGAVLVAAAAAGIAVALS